MDGKCGREKIAKRFELTSTKVKSARYSFTVSDIPAVSHFFKNNFILLPFYQLPNEFTDMPC